MGSRFSVLLLQENGAQSFGLAPPMENPPCRLAGVTAGCLGTPGLGNLPSCTAEPGRGMPGRTRFGRAGDGAGGSGQRGPQLQPRPAPQWRPGPAPPHGKAIRRLFQSTGQDELTSAPCGRGAEGQCVSLYGAQGLVLGPQALEHLSQPHSPLPEPPVFF